MTDNQHEDQEPTVGETRLTMYSRDGVERVEVEIYTGRGWLSFQDIAKGKFKKEESPE